MKLSHIAAAAGLFIAALGVGGTAEARPDDSGRYSQDHRGGDHRWDRGRGNHRGEYRGNRGRGRAYAYGRGRPRCWTEYRRHRAVRVCR